DLPRAPIHFSKNKQRPKIMPRKLKKKLGKKPDNIRVIDFPAFFCNFGPAATYPSGKGELCKSFIQRFESACRLHFRAGPIPIAPTPPLLFNTGPPNNQARRDLPGGLMDFDEGAGFPRVRMNDSPVI